MQIFGSPFEEVPKLAQLSRSECERACDILGIPYDNSTDGAYILQRRLAVHPEAEVLKAIGRHDLLPDDQATDDLRERVVAQDVKIDELMEMNRRLMAVIEGANPPTAATGDVYAALDIKQLRSEVKARGLRQRPQDKMDDLRQKLRDHDAGVQPEESPELEHPHDNVA